MHTPRTGRSRPAPFSPSLDRPGTPSNGPRHVSVAELGWIRLLKQPVHHWLVTFGWQPRRLPPFPFEAGNMGTRDQGNKGREDRPVPILMRVISRNEISCSLVPLFPASLGPWFPVFTPASSRSAVRAPAPVGAADGPVRRPTSRSTGWPRAARPGSGP